MLVFMVAAPLVWERLRGISLRSIGFRLSRTSGTVGAVAAALAGVMWYIRHGLIRAFGYDAGAGSPALLLFYFLVVAAAEETAFRGVIQRRLADLSGPYASIAIASAVFVLWHGIPVNATQLAVRFGAGVVLGVLYRWTGSLFVPVALHWGFNTVLSAA
jgi:membrane protease YdiL (CAAX protease family)